MYFNPDYLDPIFEEQQPAIFLFTHEYDENYVLEYYEAAKQLEGEFLFVVAGLSNELHRSVAKWFSIALKSELPAMFITKPGKPVTFKYRWEGKFNKLKVDDVTKFVKDFKAGTLEPFWKSEEIPPVPTVEGRTQIVGSTWDEYVNNLDNDVLVLYYTNWCHHCELVGAMMSKLSKFIFTEEIENFIAADFNEELNEVAGLEIDGYPTMILYPMGENKKNTITYKGDRTLEHVTDWLYKHSVAF